MKFWNCAEVTINAGTPTSPTPTTPPPTVGLTPTASPMEIMPSPSGIPYPCCSWNSESCDQPENTWCHESKSNCEGPCNGIYRDPYNQPPPVPTNTSAPTATPPTSIPPVSIAPVVNDTPQPVVIQTPAPSSPSNGGELFSTSNTLSAWDALLKIEPLTNVVSSNPPVYSLLASGGAAGSGDVVSEGQAYGMLISAIVLASWDSHSIGNSEANWDVAVDYFEGYFNGWKTMCLGSSTIAGCQSGGSFCKDTTLTEGKSNICLPGWKHSGDLSTEIGSGAAPDGDEDAIVAMILAIKAFDGKSEKPSWYDDLRKWADASCSSFLYHNTVVENGHRLLKLGSCWGGWGSSGNNPSYHSPGSFKVMRDYHVDFSNTDRDYSLPNYGSGSLEDHWNNLIETSYEVLSATQCPDQGMVPNWATVEMTGDEIVHAGGSFSGSGTPQWEYGSEAARTTWRVAIDAALYPDDMSSASAYLRPLLMTLEIGYDPFQPKSFLDNTFTSCAVPTSHGEQEVYPLSSGWLWNAFVYAPTVSSLVVPISEVSNSDQQDMIDEVGAGLEQNIHTSYYPLCWTILSILTINGAVESSGGLLSPSAPTSPPATLAPTIVTAAPIVPPTNGPVTPSPVATLAPTFARPINPTLTPDPTVASTPDSTPAPIAPPSQPYPCCGWPDNHGLCGQLDNGYCQANKSQCTGNCGGTWYTDPNGTTSAPVEQPSDDDGCCTWGGWNTCPDWALTSQDVCQHSAAACTGENCFGTWIDFSSDTRKLIRGSSA